MRAHSRLLFLLLIAGLMGIGGVAHAGKKVKKKRTRPGPARVIEVLEGIEDNLVETKYQHVTRVRPKRGEYFFDCSGWPTGCCAGAPRQPRGRWVVPRVGGRWRSTTTGASPRSNPANVVDPGCVSTARPWPSPGT